MKESDKLLYEFLSKVKSGEINIEWETEKIEGEEAEKDMIYFTIDTKYVSAFQHSLKEGLAYSNMIYMDRLSEKGEIELEKLERDINIDKLGK